MILASEWSNLSDEVAQALGMLLLLIVGGLIWLISEYYEIILALLIFFLFRNFLWKLWKHIDEDDSDCGGGPREGPPKPPPSPVGRMNRPTQKRRASACVHQHQKR